MKAWEICKEENVGKKFKDSDGQEWTVLEGKLEKGGFGDDVCYDLLNKSKGALITTEYYMSIISELDFEEVVDWSKVAVDTKILVSNCINGAGEVIEWKKRHFAKYENGIVYAWFDGQTSFTAELDGSCMDWEFAKLYEEGEE